MCRRRLLAVLIKAEEELEVDVLRLDSMLDQHLADRAHQIDRPAQEPFVDGLGSESAAEPALEPPSVDAPTQLGNVVGVTRENVEDLEPIRVARLELVELVAKHGRLPGAVAVDEREPALCFDLQGG